MALMRPKIYTLKKQTSMINQTFSLNTILPMYSLSVEAVEKLVI